MKQYTKVGNLDELQISIVNKKLNPTLRKRNPESSHTNAHILTVTAQYIPVIQELLRRHWPLEDYDSEFSIKTKTMHTSFRVFLSVTLDSLLIQ